MTEMYKYKSHGDMVLWLLHCGRQVVAKDQRNVVSVYEVQTNWEYNSVTFVQFNNMQVSLCSVYTYKFQNFGTSLVSRPPCAVLFFLALFGPAEARA